jgi:uncharacterized RDD family membrane protein YckC
MEENSEKKGYTYVGFWKRVCAFLLDSLFLSPFIYFYVISYKHYIENRMIGPVIIYYVFYFCYHIIFNAKSGGTPGKLVLKYRIINEEGNLLSMPKAFLRYSIYLPQTVILLLSKFVFVTPVPIMDFVDAIFTIFIMVDVLFIVFNKKKRALHDYIAKTYVITYKY